MSKFLESIIPESNKLEAGFASNHLLGQNVIEAGYNAGFVGAFSQTEGFPDWAQKAAKYMDDEFLADGGTTQFAAVAPSLADGDGECHMPFRHALELWEKNGKQGVKPYSNQQDYGSCVDASAAEGCTGLFGFRAVQAALNEEYRYASAWYWYAARGYCSDGWSGGGIATQARRHGCAFRTKYDISGNSVDFTDDDRNENIVARQWCRSGIPDWLHNHTITNHPFEDGAITQFGSQDKTEGMDKMKRLFKAGGFLHHSGVRTSGGSKPFTIGSTGAHMQTAQGYDDSDEFRRFCQDVIRVTPRDDDFPVVSHQTWGSGWRGECADQYWPSWWGPKPEGAWVWWASDILRLISCDYSWLPMVKGFPGTTPPVPPTPPVTPLSGVLYAEQAGSVIAIRGELDAAGTKYIIVPDGTGRYKPLVKPVI